MVLMNWYVKLSNMAVTPSVGDGLLGDWADMSFAAALNSNPTSNDTSLETAHIYTNIDETPYIKIKTAGNYVLSVVMSDSMSIACSIDLIINGTSTNLADNFLESTSVNFIVTGDNISNGDVYISVNFMSFDSSVIAFDTISMTLQKEISGEDLAISLDHMNTAWEKISEKYSSVKSITDAITGLEDSSGADSTNPTVIPSGELAYMIKRFSRYGETLYANFGINGTTTYSTLIADTDTSRICKYGDGLTFKNTSIYSVEVPPSTSTDGTLTRFTNNLFDVSDLSTKGTIKIRLSGTYRISTLVSLITNTDPTTNTPLTTYGGSPHSLYIVKSDSADLSSGDLNILATTSIDYHIDKVTFTYLAMWEGSLEAGDYVSIVMDIKDYQGVLTFAHYTNMTMTCLGITE